MKKLLSIIFCLAALYGAAQTTQPRANQIKNTPAGTISATNVQAAIDELNVEKGNTGIYDVTKYGLLGDNSTDNITAINSLISSISAGSVLYFPAGSYRFSSAIQVNKVVHFKGAGRNHSYLIGTTNDELLHYTRATSGVILENIGFYTTVSSPTSANIGIRADTATTWAVKNVYTYGFYDNVRLTQVWEDVWDGFYCTGWVNAGMSRTNSSIYTDAGDASIINSYFIPNTRNSVYSIFQQNGGGTKITNTKFNYISAGPYKAQYHYYYNGAGITVDLDISNCSFENYSTAAIRVGRSSGSFSQISITGNDIGGTSTGSTKGVILSNVDLASITGNSFINIASGTTVAIDLSNVNDISLNNVYSGWTTNVATAGSNTNINSAVPDTRTLTINGTAHDLSANRSWTVSGGGGGTAAGSTGYAQYKSAGGGFQAEAAYTYDSATNTLDVDKVTVDVLAYNASTWNGSSNVPTRDDIRDKIESITYDFVVAASNEYTALTAGTTKVTFRMPRARTLVSIKASLTTAQASGSNLVTVDVNESGTTILSTKLTFDNTETTTVTAATAAVISDTALAADAVITVDIDNIEAASVASGLKITFEWQ